MTSDSLREKSLVAAGEAALIRINLTDMVSWWHRGELANNGIAVSMSENTKSQLPQYVEEAGEIKAVLSVHYSK
jgi:hypothetical protein